MAVVSVVGPCARAGDATATAKARMSEVPGNIRIVTPVSGRRPRSRRARVWHPVCQRLARPDSSGRVRRRPSERGRGTASCESGSRSDRPSWPGGARSRNTTERKFNRGRSSIRRGPLPREDRRPGGGRSGSGPSPTAGYCKLELGPRRGTRARCDRSSLEDVARAIAADFNYSAVHHSYADFLAGRGRFTETLEPVSIAHRLDPLRSDPGYPQELARMGIDPREGRGEASSFRAASGGSSAR